MVPGVGCVSEQVDLMPNIDLTKLVFVVLMLVVIVVSLGAAFGSVEFGADVGREGFQALKSPAEFVTGQQSYSPVWVVKDLAFTVFDERVDFTVLAVLFSGVVGIVVAVYTIRVLGKILGS